MFELHKEEESSTLSNDEIGKLLREILAAPEKPFPVFTGDPKRAYDSISDQLKLDPRAVTDPPQSPAILENARRPENIPEGAWLEVMKQLRTELVYKTATYLFFRRFDVFNVKLFQDVATYFGTARELATAAADDESSFLFSALIKVGTAAMGSLDIPGVGVAIALFEIALEWAQSSGEASRDTVQGTFHELSKKLIQDFRGTSLQTGKMEEKVLRRWGSLEPMGRSLTNGQLRWPASSDEVKMAASALTAYQISLWKIILPAVWNLMRPQKDPEFHSRIDWFGRYIEVNPNYYLRAEPSGSGYAVYTRWLGRGAFPLGHQQPSATLCKEIFRTLKIERQKLFGETDGWKGFTKQTLIECSGSQLAAVMTAGEADPVFEEHLRLLRQLRSDFGASPMGRWYLKVYDEVAPRVMELYHTDPDRAIAHAIDRFKGQAVYDAFVEALRSGRSGLDRKHLSSLNLITQEVVNTSVRRLGEDNPVRRRMPEVITRSFQYVGKTYPQVLEILRGETPPD
ncbi:MAG TPA: hypothetical protein VLX28_09410 [Thermoanaerobaculia bacterium]|nr:hypothetical protein [Thermoanaerobaculia bacterium]